MLRNKFLTLLMAGLFATPLSAARDSSIERSNAEIVVYEARTSLYSAHFRDSILPVIRPMTAQRRLPIRFVDVQETTSDGVGLKSAITMVPTLVLFRDGREGGRIAGLYGVAEYQRLLGDLLAETSTAAD